MSDSTAKYWQGIIEGLDALLSTLRENFVCETRFYTSTYLSLKDNILLLSLFIVTGSSGSYPEDTFSGFLTNQCPTVEQVRERLFTCLCVLEYESL